MKQTTSGSQSLTNKLRVACLLEKAHETSFSAFMSFFVVEILDARSNQLFTLSRRLSKARDSFLLLVWLVDVSEILDIGLKSRGGEIILHIILRFSPDADVY